MPTSAATVPTPGIMSVPLRRTRSKRGLTTVHAVSVAGDHARAFEAGQAT
jgi:hypothetical protein